MQQSANPAILPEAVESELAALEALCGRIERALMLRAWNELQAAIDESRRVTHALENAVDAQPGGRDALDGGARDRIARVQMIRANQLTRLQQYHDAVGERLQIVTRWKSALRTIRRERPVSRLASLDLLT